MKYPHPVTVAQKLIVAALVAIALISVVSVARRASSEAVVAKAQAFEQSVAIQTAARERRGIAVAVRKN